MNITQSSQTGDLSLRGWFTPFLIPDFPFWEFISHGQSTETLKPAQFIEFCDRHRIPYQLCGKVIVATHNEELPRLDELLRRGTANGVPGLEMIGPERLKDIEPYTNGIRALYVPGTGIIDFTRVAKAYAERFRSSGGEVRTSHEVRGVAQGNDGLIIETLAGEFRSKYSINCAGLFVDRIAKITFPQRS